MSDKSKPKSSESEIDDEGLSALSALVRPSMPPSSAEEDEADDGKLDLRALAASVPPAASTEDDEADLGSSEGKVDLSAAGAASEDVERPSGPPAAAAPASASAAPTAAKPKKKKAKGKKKAGATAASAPKKKAAPVAPVAEPEEPAVAARATVAEPKSGGGLWIGLAIGAAVAAGAAWFIMNDDTSAAGSETIAAAPTTVEGVSDEGAEGARLGDPVEEVGALAAPADSDTAPSAEPEPSEPSEAADPVPDEEASEPAVAASPTDARRARAARAAATARREPTPRAEEAPTPAQQPSAASAGGSSGAARADARQAATSGQRDDGAGDSQLDGVLDQALGGRPNRDGTSTGGGGSSEPSRAERAVAASPSASAGNLPANPSRRDIARTLGGLMPRIRQCAGDQVGMALATILVRSDGSVASVSVGGNPFGGSPQGACMEGALRGAQFPPFQQSTFRVSYPFNIR